MNPFTPTLPFLRILPALVLASALQAAEPLAPADQLALFEQLAAKTYRADHAKDADGNITFVCFNQHDAFKKDNPGAPGLTDADLALLARFPGLQGLTLQRQPVTDAGLAVLASLPDLRVASLPDLKTNKAAPVKPTSLALKHLDGARHLQVLDLTHSFDMQKDPSVLQDLQGFPDLRVLVVDVGHADDFAEFFPFVQKSPRLERLKLHRTNFTEAQFAQILATLPNLKVLEIKPSGNTPGQNWSHTSLKLIAQHPNIDILRLIQKDALPLPWAGGLEHLVAAKNLKTFSFPNAGYEIKGIEDRMVTPEDLAKLQAARPDLKINPPGKPADHYAHTNPAPYDWEIGPR